MKYNTMQEEKPYTIKYDYREKYLYALVSGEKDSLEVSLQFWQAIFDESEAKNYKRILIAENFRNNISAIDLYILGEKLIEMAPRNISVAFIDKQVQQMEMNRFSETVIYNRGGRGKILADFQAWEEQGAQNTCERIFAPITTSAMSTGPRMKPTIPMNGTPAKMPIIMMTGRTATRLPLMTGR